MIFIWMLNLTLNKSFMRRLLPFLTQLSRQQGHPKVERASDTYFHFKEQTKSYLRLFNISGQNHAFFNYEASCLE